MLTDGTVVEIFEDPLTMTRKEGNARIVEHVEAIVPGLDLYRVNFIGDDPRTVVERRVADMPLCICTDPMHPDNPQCKVHGAQVPAHWVGGA